AHAGIARARDHLRAVGVELGYVQVAVAVDQVHQRPGGSTCDRAGSGSLRRFQLASSRVPRPSATSSMNGTGSGSSTLSTNTAAVSLNRVGKRNRRAHSSRGSNRGLAMAAAPWGRSGYQHAASAPARGDVGKLFGVLFSFAVMECARQTAGWVPQEPTAMKQATTVLIAAGALLVGGIATAAYMNNRDGGSDVAAITAPAQDGDVAASDALPETPALEFAEILSVTPVTEKEQRYATVIGTEPVRESTTQSVPHEVCEDVVVQERLPERDGNVGGTVAGAVIGGLIGNQVGGGKGKKVATAAGAVAGGVIGNQVDKRHVGGKVVSRTERQCRTEYATSESS